MRLKFLLISILYTSLLLAQNSDSTFHFFFRSGAHTQGSDSLAKFLQFYKRFENCHTCVITLEGYTDKVGDTKSNFILAEKRIAFVENLLANKIVNQVKKIVIGEEKAETESPNQAYRLVKLIIFSPPTIPVEFEKTEEVNKLDTVENKIEETPVVKQKPEELRLEEFKVRDKAIQLKILFYPGSTDLIRSSMSDLEILFNYLNDNKQVKAHIVGHVCCSPEMKLSKQRAEIVYDYLVERGIDKKRLSYTGVSNTQPLVQEVDEATQKMNRRVEVFFTE